MTEVIEYKGKKFHVEEDYVDGGVISAFLHSVPELPDEDTPAHGYFAKVVD